MAKAVSRSSPDPLEDDGYIDIYDACERLSLDEIFPEEGILLDESCEDRDELTEAEWQAWLAQVEEEVAQEKEAQGIVEGFEMLAEGDDSLLEE